MKTTDSTKHGTHQNDLVSLAREINDREEIIRATQAQACERTSALLRDIALQGQALLKVKGLLKHGDFMPWLMAHCGNTGRQARDYMRLALNWNRIEDLVEIKSLRDAMQLIAGSDQDEGDKAPAKSWPPFLEAIGRFGKFASCVERNPLLNWPLEGREKLAEKMLPIASALWPEKFA